jgi:hypothetical protein
MPPLRAPRNSFWRALTHVGRHGLHDLPRFAGFPVTPNLRLTHMPLTRALFPK